MTQDHMHGAHSGHGGHGGHLGPEDQPDTHGMMVVGEETVFFSHLPMFSHKHHDFQVIMEVTLTQEGDDPHSVYVNDRRNHPDTRMYTFKPDPFILPDLMTDDPTHPPRRSFTGTLFRGHWERESHEIIRDVQVNVENIIYFRQFDPDAERRSALEGLLFGKGEELFLAHLITRAPDFDQILSVRVHNHDFTDAELSRGIPVVFPDRPNTARTRIRPGEQVAGEIPMPILIEADTEFYFEEGELGSKFSMKPTDEEIDAGFG